MKERTVQEFQEFVCRCDPSNARFVSAGSAEMLQPVKCSRCGKRMRNATDPAFRASARDAKILMALGNKELEAGRTYVSPDPKPKNVVEFRKLS